MDGGFEVIPEHRPGSPVMLRVGASFSRSLVLGRNRATKVLTSGTGTAPPALLFLHLRLLTVRALKSVRLAERTHCWWEFVL
jgi:hypothetical protein